MKSLYHAPLFLLALLLNISVQASERGAAIPDYPAERVAENSYVIHGPKGLPSPENHGFMNNPGFLVTTAGVVIVDPGSSVQTGEMVLRQIRKITKLPVVAVFNTHVHGDHWLGNQAIHSAYPKAKIYAHPNLIKAVKEQGAGDTWVELMDSMTQGATQGTHVVPADQAIKNGETVTIGGIVFTAHHLGPAHTNTDIMISTNTGMVFTGDNCGNTRVLRIDHGSMKGNIESLQAMIKLKPSVVVPGHGPTGDISVLNNYLFYLSTIYQAVKKGYEEDLSDFEIKPLISPKLAAFHDWSGYEDELGKHISEAFLEIEAADF